MPENHKLTLVVARPGPLRYSLRALMSTVPEIEIVEETADVSSVLSVVAEHHPALVVLETGLLGDDMWTWFRQIKAAWPRARWIVLADNRRMQEGAVAAGADAVLLKGFPAARLVAAIEGLLREQ